MTDLETSLDHLDDVRKAFLARVEGLTDAQRAFRPSPDAWGPVEIAEHVWRVDNATLRGLERQIRAGDSRRDLGPRIPGGLDRLAEAMDEGMRIAMPEREAPYIRPQGLTLGDVRQAWSETGREWRRVAASVPDDLAETGVVGHSIAGPLSPAESARFAALHAGHHGHQLDRVLAAPDFPTS